ncbi:hypothetical protein ACQ4PT_016849 [Festuca glaucescens]
MGKKKVASCSTGDATSRKERASGWGRSSFSAGDLRKLQKSGLLSAMTEVNIPGKEVVPRPKEGWRVIFLAFILCGLSVPAHEFLHGLLFVYGMQLHQLTPNSILHIACFITLCECFLGIHPHWGMWRRIFFIRRNASKDAVHDVGSAIISVRAEADYFDFKMAESVQNWHKKWFYIKDEKGHTFLSCLPPLPEEGEIPEVAADAEGETPEAAAGQEIAETDEDEAFNSAHTETSIPPTNCQDEGTKGKRKDEEETPKDPATEHAKILLAFIKTPAKTLSPREETVDSPRLEEPTKIPRAPPKKRTKKTNANKGIKIFENPPIPSMDDPIALEMMDMAISYIRFRDEASELSAALMKSEKHAEELEEKLKATEVALEDARAQATTKEEEWEEEKSKMATREADIHQRLEALNDSFIKKVGDSYEMPEDQRTDPLLDSVTILEANSVRVCNVLVRARRAFKRLFGNFFPKQKEPEDILDLADVFNAEQDEALDYRRAATKTGVEVAMATAHGENVKWDKPSPDDWVDPEFASGPSQQESMPEGPSTSEVADPTTQSSEPLPDTGGTQHFEELQSELKILKDQIVVALSKVKRAAECEDYLLDLISRVNDDLLCVQLNPVTETKRIKACINALMGISAGIGSAFWTDHK